MTANRWCDALGIEPPDLEVVKDHREANTYARLIVALLERGEPMTLSEVAWRLDEVGVAATSAPRAATPGRAARARAAPRR